MNIKNKIKELKASGIKFNEIAKGTGYSNAYVSKVYREHIDPSKDFRVALKTFLLNDEPPKENTNTLEQENQELRTLVEQLQNKLNEIQKIVSVQE
jgi:transcriptional regulator with XRE-family HTH domain